MRLFLGTATLLVALAGCTGSQPAPLGEPVSIAQTSGTDALLISAYAVTENVVWLSGTNGTVVRTTDGGDSWTAMTVPGADSLQFRDVHAWSERDALVLSIGNGADSRIYRTTDGGSTWAQTWVNDEPDAFYDCLDFWDDRVGFVFSDAVDGRFRVRRTMDGGVTWTLVPDANLPPAQDAEGSFASSGTCVSAHGEATAWIGTGNAETPRLLTSADRGASWTAMTLPLAGGEAAGTATLAIGTSGQAVAAGGDIGRPAEYDRAVAVTTDGGQTWREGGQLPFTGALYGAAFVPDTEAVLGVGPGGVALSLDGGNAWRLLSDETHWGLATVGRTAWLVGPEGRVTRVNF
ncbi:MAG: hypothetical protein AAF791_15405 [Bacteroidota bacterium]